MNVRVVLVEPENQGNIGAVARLMKNFGLSRLFLVKPKVELGNQAYSRAVHADDVLEECIIVENLNDALIGVQWVIGTTSIVAKNPSNLRRTAIPPTEVATRIKNRCGEAALLLGREGSGLLNRELEVCDIVVSIPSSPNYRTLNVATASAILFYELWKAGVKRVERGCIKEANPQFKEQLVNTFNNLVLKVRVPKHLENLANKAFRNIISRAFISEREATLLIGVLRRAIKA